MSKSLRLSDIFQLTGKQHIVIGSSGSGKTFFTMQILEKISFPETIIIFGKDEKEWEDYIKNENKKIKFVSDDPFSTDYIFTLENVIVIFDDYAQEKKNENKFYRFVNYHIRHHNICFFLITHSIYKSNLFTKILSAPSLFLTSCSANLFLVQKYDKMYNTNLTNILRENILNLSESYRPIIYITPKFIINSFEELINPTTNQERVRMFKQDHTYYLLSTENYKFEASTDECSTKLDEILNDFQDMYPTKYKKIKKLIIQLYTFLEKNNLIDTVTLDINIKNKAQINFFDFIIASQDFSKKTTAPKVKAILQYLKDKNFKVPRFTVQNHQFKSLLT